MRKIITCFQTLNALFLIGLMPTACSDEHNAATTKSDISSLVISDVTTRVDLRIDTYNDVLINDNVKTKDPAFKNILINKMNDFAAKKHIFLSYGEDYSFILQSYDPFSKINQLGPIDVLVKASKFNNKIKGSFPVKINLINNPISINGITIGQQSYSKVQLSKTKFLDVIGDPNILNVIKNKVKAVCPSAEAFDDYAINFSGKDLTALITQSDLDQTVPFTINVNALTKKHNYPLTGSFHFQITLSKAT